MTVQHGISGALLLLSLVSSAGIVSCAHNPQDQSFVSVKSLQRPVPVAHGSLPDVIALENNHGHLPV